MMFFNVHYTFFVPFIGFILAVLTVFSINNTERARKFLVYSSILFIIGWLIYEYPFITLDTTQHEVLWNTSPSLPLWMKIAAAWVGGGGSLYLFTTVSSIGILYLVLRKDKTEIREKPMYLLLSLVLIAGFLSSYFHDAFTKVEEPSLSGAGINPLLKSPWVFPHPLTTFTGYALLSIASIGMMFNYLRKGYALFLLGWSSLTFGIMIGGYWSYETFGWGGYWAWDPVETSQLMVWLAATLIPHIRVLSLNASLLLTRFLVSSVFIAMYLTRTGLSPLHSFASANIGSITLLLVGILFLVYGLFGVASLQFTNMKDSLKKYVKTGPYNLGVIISAISLLAAFFFVYGSLLTPSVVVAFGKQVNVPQMDTGIKYYHRVLYPLLLLILYALPYSLLGEKLRWRTIYSLTIASIIFSTILAISALQNKLVIAPLDPPTTNAKIVFALIPASVTVFSALYAMVMNYWGAKRKAELWKSIGFPLIHFGLAITVLGILVSGAYSYGEHYMNEATLKPGDTKIVPGIGEIKLESIDYGVTKSPVDIYTKYVMRATSYYLAWEAISFMKEDIGGVMSSLKNVSIELQNPINKLFYNLTQNHLKLEENVTISLRPGIIHMVNLATSNTTLVFNTTENTSIEMDNPVVLVRTNYMRDDQGRIIGTMAHFVLYAEKISFNKIEKITEISSPNFFHTYFLLELKEPIKFALNKTGIVLNITKIYIAPKPLVEGTDEQSSMEITGDTVTLEKFYLYFWGEAIIDDRHVQIPYKTGRWLQDYLNYGNATTPYINLLKTTTAYEVLSDPQKLENIIHSEENCKSGGSCIGFVRSPQLVPENSYMRMKLLINGKDVVEGEIRFEINGEIQGIHGLVPKVLHVRKGITDYYLVLYPKLITESIEGIQLTSYHELLVYYLHEAFKELTPEERLALATIVAAGYLMDNLLKLQPADRAFQLEKAALDLYILAEKYNVSNSNLGNQGFEVDFKVLPAVPLVWYGSIVMGLAAIFNAIFLVIGRRSV